MEPNLKVNTNRERRTQTCESAIRSFPRCPMNVLRKHLNVFDRCRRQDAVAEIEDMARATSDALQDVFGLIEHPPGGTEQQRGIQVSLNGAIEADVLPR